MANQASELPSPAPFDPEAIPETVTLSRGGTALTLTWRDGLEAALPAEHLRLRCRCAWCTRDRAVGAFPESVPGVAVARVDPMGSYAVHIAFTDGHARGIFLWAYLRALAADAVENPPAAARAA